MKLLFVTPGKLPVPATSGGAVENLIEILINENENSNKYDITLISNYTKEAKEKSKKYKNTKFIFINTDDIFYKIKRIFRYIINRIPNVYIGNAYISRVNKVLKKDENKYDKVIIENSPEYGLILEKKYNNLYLHMHNDFLNNKTNMAKKIVNCYSRIFSLSEYITSRIKEIDRNYNRVYTLYNGIETNKFCDKKNNDVRDMYNISENDFVYLYSGRIVPEKGVKELIDAFNQIEDQGSKLLIVGNLEQKNMKNKVYLKKLKKISKNNKNIIFTGAITYSEIPKYYSCANVGVIPSIWEEPFALTVIENMSVGNPVIVSNSGGMPELVNEKCAIIVNKKENFSNNLYLAMTQIKKDYKKFKTSDILSQSEKFNSEKYCERFEELIKEG